MKIIIITEYLFEVMSTVLCVSFFIATKLNYFLEWLSDHEALTAIEVLIS